MKSTGSIAANAANAKAHHDNLVDPKSREIIRVDQRLFDQSVWLHQPELVHHLMTNTATYGTIEGVASLAQSYLATSVDKVEPTTCALRDSDYFLVLGHQLNPDATPSPELITRLECTLWASEKNPDARVVVSGGAQAGGVRESEVMKRWLVDRGVGAERVLQESRSLDTVENIRMSTRLLIQENAKDVCLITGDKAARRGACLLSSYLQHIDSTIRATHLSPPVARQIRACADMETIEKFLLFKDLGRIFGLWTYRKWSRRAA